MKFLIAGASGQLAKSIIGLMNNKALEFEAPGEGQFDITDLTSVRQVVDSYRPDVLINCAAYNAVDAAEKDWQKAYLVNGVGVRNLALAAEKVNAVLVHFSTDYVFDGTKKEPYTIADRPSPASKYGDSKLLGEMYVRDLMQKFFLVRLSWVFGSGEFSFPTKILQWSSKNSRLRIVDDQVACPAYAEHLAGAVLDLVSSGAFGLYHMTNSGFCSRYEWAKYVLDRIGWEGELEPAKSSDFQTAAVRPPFSVLDNFPLRETIGYQLPSWQEATDQFLGEIR